MLSIVVPVYNESRRVGRSLERLDAFGCAHVEIDKIIFVDDGSVDNTVVLVESFLNTHSSSKISLLRHQVNQGKGAAVKTGMLASTSENTAFIDVDFSAPPEEFLRMLPLMKESDVVIASRYLPESRINKPFPLLRRCMSWTYNTLRKLILKQSIKDSQCGLKMFNRKAIQVIFSKTTISGLAFDTEVLTIAQANDIRVKELGVSWSYDGYGNLKPFRSSIRMFKDLIRIRFNLSFGVYSSSKVR